MLFLDLLGLGERQAQAGGNIVGDMVSAHRQHHGVPDMPIHVDGQVGRPAADIADGHAHLAFSVGEYHVAGGQRVQHELQHFHAGRADALAQVFDRALGGGDDVRLHFQTVAVHSNRHRNTVLAVHREAALDDVDDLPVVRDGDRLGRIQCTDHVTLVDHLARDPGYAAAVDG